jgi:hypothetical protein
MAQRPCDAFARATELSHLAAAALRDGRPARAAELYGRAVATAKEQRVAPDCLVTAFLLAERAHALMRVGRLQATPSSRAYIEAAEGVVRDVTPEAMAILERRAAAGTLLGAGAVRPAEQAWFAARRACTAADAVVPTSGDGGAATATTAASSVLITSSVSGVLGGYEAVLSTADVLLSALFDLDDDMPPCSTMACCIIAFKDIRALRAAHAFVLRALELMAAAPRDVQPRAFLPLEAALARHLRKLQPRMSPPGHQMQAFCCPPGWDGGDEFPVSGWLALRDALAAAWARVQRAPPFRALGSVEAMLASAAAAAAALHARAARASEASKLRSCALPACAAQELHVRHFKHCAACRTAVYCSRAHQVADWPRHKTACKKAAKKAAGDDDAA